MLPRALPSLRSSRIIGALSALAAATLVGGAIVVTSTAQAASGCQVTYQPNSWAGGFTATVKLTTATALNGWTVNWTYAGDQKISNAWNATVTTSGAAVTATNATWNGQLAAGASAEFGVQGTWSAANPTPTAFTLNGTACNGTTTASSPPVPSTPAATTPPVTSPPASPSRTTPPPTTAPPTTAPPTTAPPTTTPPTTSPPTGGTGCSGVAFCDGFETQTGTAPAGNWSVVFPNCSGTGTATIDPTVAHSGTKSVRINGGGGYCNHVFVKAGVDVAAAGPVWYGRMYVRHSTALPAGHVAFMAMKDTNDGGKDLRMGGQNQALQWNRESDDATLPEQSPVGVAQSVPLPTNQWNCVEFLVDGSTGTLRTWLGGTAIPGLVADGVPTPDVDRQWLNRTWRPALADLKLGWESYGADTDTLWFDDIALGSSRIGC